LSPDVNKPVCGDNCGILPPCAPLAVPYVPFQQCSPKKYTQAQALENGTLFPGLNLPFHIKAEATALGLSPLTELQALPGKMQQYLEHYEQTQYYASRYFNHDSIFFIGRNLDYAMGLEGSLKLKEISYIHSEAYASGELKHGTISLIEPGTLVVALGTHTALFDKAMSNVVEVKARGASVLAVTTEAFRERMEKTADAVISVPDTHPLLQPSLSIVPLQLFAYYVALQRGCDIDKPRNLAKSVTVE